jgi:hypothetical protein
VSVEAIRALAVLAFDEAAAETDGCEIRFSLFSMTRTLIENQGLVWRSVPPLVFAETYARPVLLAVCAGRDEVSRRSGKPILLRLGLSRTFESEAHYAALAAMVREHVSSLVGFDVLGIVPPPDPEPLPLGLVRILEGLLGEVNDLTIHAGEFSGPESVERTLALSPRAIGHGVRSLEDPSVLERLEARGLTLEVCPTSNRLLIPSTLARLGCEPLVALQHARIHCVLGSDDPTPMGTSFAQEMALARAAGVDMQRLERDMERRWNQLQPSAVGRPSASSAPLTTDR